MEFTFSQLKQKDVISLTDGKNLGRVCDVTFSYPENNLLGITVTGSRGFKFSRQDVFIPIVNVVKIGEDAVLVRSEEHGKCAPDKPPKCPPNKPPKCPPPCPPCPPEPPYRPPCPQDRRSYDEYE